MKTHVITKDYSQLRGFTTDSKFKRPAYVADLAVNIQRLPDGTFAPRRGYQAQTADIGGLGVSIFQNRIDQETQDICINHDGNLYKKRTGSITIDFTGTVPQEYVTYEIYVDETTVSDITDCDFDPYAVVAEEALVNDSINFRFKKLTDFAGQAIGSGSTTYSGTLSGAPLTPGSVIMTDGTLTIFDNANGGFTGNTGVGPNTIDYVTGNYTVTFSAVTGAVTASYRSSLQVQFDQRMGKGFGVTSPYLISTLIGQLSAVSGVVVSSVGQTNHPGAFLEVSEEVIIPSTKSATLNFYWWESVNRTVPVTFAGLLSRLPFDDFQNATFAAYQEVIYIANPNDDVQKYDGQTVYKAGMPNAPEPSAVGAGTGSGVDTGAHNYYITYQQIDATGRLVEGVLSDPFLITLGSPEDVVVTVTNLLQGSGWNTDGAIIDGSFGPGNTIPVLVGHTMRVGDKAFFIDTSEVAHTRNVTAITATSITIDGAPVTVDDSEEWRKAISNNLSINIWRTKAPAGTIPYLVRQIPNNSYQATTDYLDNTADTDLIEQYETPPRRPDPPPRVGVVFPFNNQIIYTRDPVNDDYVWYSDPDQPEYVSQLPVRGNFFIVPSNDDDVTGAGAAGSTLVIFKQKSIFSISGDISASKFTVTAVAPGSNIGCVTHHTIVSVGSLLYFLHTNGVFALAENNIFPTDQFGNPIPLSIMIDSVFRNTTEIQNQRYRLTRAVAINYTKDNQYLLFLPAEEIEGVRFANNNSRVLCYDYQGKNWFSWTRINAAGGFYVTSDNLFWQERRAATDGITSNTYLQHRKYRLIDQSDHVTSIRVTWCSSWEDLGQPRVRKKFVRAIMLFDNISTVFQLNRPKLCFTSFVDWNDGVVSTKTDLTTRIESQVWNVPPWDWTKWSGYQDTFITVPLKGGTVNKSMKIQLQLNKLNTSFSMQGFQLEISPDFRKTIVR